MFLTAACGPGQAASLDPAAFARRYCTRDWAVQATAMQKTGRPATTDTLNMTIAAAM